MSSRRTALRCRFAPSPTGSMHLGGVRTALTNYCIAKSHNGTFIIRIEDTDKARNQTHAVQEILTDLAWLGMSHAEGPDCGGPHAPYLQSERSYIYQAALEKLKTKQAVYRCFCSAELLEKKRLQQQALKMPPRYDKSCAHLSESAIQELLDHRTSYIWRFALDQSQSVTVHDIARGTIHFELKNFSDFPVTRQDGSFTFMFANCIDDIDMPITHVVRGEDHLTNTVGQIALYQACNATVPLFLHLSLMTNTEGQKLSKRDFGFSLADLREGGFLPEAVTNYLAIIGGGTFSAEIMSLDALAKEYTLDALARSAGAIRYDVAKLRWFNQQWILRLQAEELLERMRPFLEKAYRPLTELDYQLLMLHIDILRVAMTTLTDSVPLLQFYFIAPQSSDILTLLATDHNGLTLSRAAADISKTATVNTYVTALKAYAQQQNIAAKQIFSAIRLILTGSTKGLTLQEIVSILGIDEVRRRLQQGIEVLQKSTL